MRYDYNSQIRKGSAYVSRFVIAAVSVHPGSWNAICTKKAYIYSHNECGELYDMPSVKSKIITIGVPEAGVMVKVFVPPLSVMLLAALICS